MVEEAVEDCSGEDVVAEDLAPLGNQLIGRDKKAALLIATCDKLEEEMGGALLEWQVNELIGNEELWLCEEAGFVAEVPTELSTLERTEKAGGVGQDVRVSRLDDGAAEGDGEVGLADARRAE